MQKNAELQALLTVVEQLRAEEGCPWDRAQTHETLIPFLEEESCEVIDAIREKDPEHLKEELADLLLQILLHSQIASENKEFDFMDVVSLLKEKMIRRHPHVFAGKKYSSIAEQKADWQRIKAEERKAKGQCEALSLLSSIPQSMPALKQAALLQAKAATVGFDWDDIGPVIDKVDEERAELGEAMMIGHKAEIKSELGDLFFSLVNLARFLEITPDEALHSTNQKFRRRFNYIERVSGVPLETLSLEALDDYWNEAKQKESLQAPDSLTENRQDDGVIDPNGDVR